MAVALIIASSVWLYRVQVNKHNIMVFHHFITVVLTATTIEFILTYIEFDIYNGEGVRNSFLLILNVTLASTRNTMARVLMVVMALGYGITVSQIDKYKMLIGVLGCFYWISYTVFTVLAYSNQYSAVSLSVLFFTSAIVSLVNSVFFVVVFVNLQHNLKQLKQRKQGIKAGIM